jgi:hypothetical protein
MYIFETITCTRCSQILTSALFFLVCYGATPCVAFRLKSGNSISISVLQIFKKYGFHEKVEVTNPVFLILLEICKTNVLIPMRTCVCYSVFYC